MHKLHPAFLLIVVLLIISLACVLPAAAATPDPNSVGTAIAQTLAVIVQQTQFAPTMAPIIQVSNTPVFTITPQLATFTPEPPTFTPTVTLTSTPAFTFTPLVPQISVSVNTNCRVGPGKVYDRVGALLIGEYAEVAGRNPTNDYWYIRNPDRTGGFCWLWGEYATLGGNFAALPVFTPPPTPTPVPNFAPSYSGLDTCVGWWVDLRLENTGGINFKSVSLTLRDTTNENVLSLYADGFTVRNGCLETVVKDNLQPGNKVTVSSPSFGYDPTGHKLRATITLCSNTANSGTCVSQVITFTP